VLHAFPDASIVVKAAAVADYRVAAPASQKIRSKQENLSIDLAPTADILGELQASKGTRFLVGFAAETADVVERAHRKLVGKGVDLIVANDVGRADIGFDVAENEVIMIDRWGGRVALPRLPKAEVADRILDRVVTLRQGVPAGPRGVTA